MGDKLLLIGGGGHCKSILDTLYRCSSYKEIGIIESSNTETNYILDTPVIGTDKDLPDLLSNGFLDAFVAVGSIGSPHVRKKLTELIMKLGFHIPNIVDPSAIISAKCSLGQGIFIGKNVIVNANTNIDDFAIINTGAIIEHDCTVKQFAHIAPGTVLCGNVYVGKNSHIGANSTVIQGISISKNTIIGAGSTVIRSICDEGKYCGVPAKRI